MSGAVGIICLGILVLFTEIEDDLVRWVNCGPLAAGRERSTDICR
ncbi:MAG: hypothetical protein ACKO8I_14875 [Cyanobacteriota bacterium]